MEVKAADLKKGMTGGDVRVGRRRSKDRDRVRDKGRERVRPVQRKLGGYWAQMALGQHRHRWHTWVSCRDSDT